MYHIIQEILQTDRTQIPGPNPDLPAKAPAKEKWPPEVRRVVLFIHTYLFDPRLTVEWLRQQCHISSESFPGKFRYYVGTYPRQYWVKHRIEASKLLLREKSLKEIPIITIAISVGFESQAAFSITFKKYVGMPPGKWRQTEMEG